MMTRLSFAVVALVLAAACGSDRQPTPLPDSGADRPETPPPPPGDAAKDTKTPADVVPDVTPDQPSAPDAKDAPTELPLSDARDAPVVDVPAAELPLTSVDVSSETAGEAGRDNSDATDAAACAGLSGSAPFGKALAGTGSFRRVSGAATMLTQAVYVYFPAGRVAGAPVQLALQSGVVLGQYFFGPQATLATDLSAAGLSVGGHGTLVTGNLLPGDGGLQATVEKNFGDPGSDVGEMSWATMSMCPAGDVPAPALQVSATTLGPLSTLAINSTTPLAGDAMGALRIVSPVGPVTFKASAQPNSLYASGPCWTIAPASAFPPGQPLAFDTSAVKDVLGRPVPATVGGTQVLATMAVVSDLTLATAPPPGAVACTGCTPSSVDAVDGGTASGMVTCTGGGTLTQGVLNVSLGGPRTGSTVDALVALPAASASRLRVRMVVGDVNQVGTACWKNGQLTSLPTGTGVVSVVGPNGEGSAPQNLACDGTMTDHVIDLPKASPLWLVVHLEGGTPMPYFSPGPILPGFSIDEMELL